MVFTVLTLAQLAHVLAIRSQTQSLFEQGLRSNLPLTGAVLLTLALQMATIYVPLLQPIFRTEGLVDDRAGAELRGRKRRVHRRGTRKGRAAGVVANTRCRCTSPRMRSRGTRGRAGRGLPMRTLA